MDEEDIAMLRELKAKGYSSAEIVEAYRALMTLPEMRADPEPIVSGMDLALRQMCPERFL